MEAVLEDGILRIPVSNVSAVDGDEVVQVYVKAVADTEGPAKSLRGFRRVHIKAGESVVVEIPMGAEDIDLFNPETGKMEGAPGEYVAYYGGTSDEDRLNTLKFNI